MSEVTEKKYKIEYKPNKHIFLLRILDSFSKDDARIFFADYDKETKKFEADHTSIVVDCSRLTNIDSEFELIFVNLVKLFMELHFRFRVFLKSESLECDDIIKSAMNEGGMVYGKDGIFVDDMDAVHLLLEMY